jgi:hypothetical protein
MAQKTAWDAATLTESDINTYLMGEGGAWTSWTPTVTQSGSVTVTNTRSRYARYGRTIHFSAQLVVTGSGTSSTAISISLPVTAASADTTIGTGVFIDASTGNYYPAILYASTTTAFQLWDSTVSSTVLVVGNANFSGALASGDVFRVSGTYEAAS